LNILLAISFLTSLAVAAEADVTPEVRAIWVTRWSYKTAADIDAILDDCQESNANTVLWQIRGRFDAFYDSPYEPWAQELTGTLGQHPGFDPLAHAIDGAKARDLELHAWMNAYPIWSGHVPPAGDHPLVAHPDWLVHQDKKPMKANDHYVFAAPGHPEVKAHLIKVVTDVARRYDVDGIHLDYIRYPGLEYSDPDGATTPDTRRKRIGETVAEIQQKIDQPLTAAVWGIYENSFGWQPGVSQGNHSYHQDARSWLASGALDAAVPMIYWPVAETRGARLDFATLAADHAANSSDRHVWAGMNADTMTWPQLVDCIKAAREAKSEGVAIFEYRALRDKGWISKLAQGPFAQKAEPPTMEWLNPPPDTPEQ
jgi:uncharacterized lipoprotein YddW (UPF0748 family)